MPATPHPWRRLPGTAKAPTRRSLSTLTRALRKSGGLGGYHWGLPVKRAMLAWESARADA